MATRPPHMYGGVPTGAIVNIIMPAQERQRRQAEETRRINEEYERQKHAESRRLREEKERRDIEALRNPRKKEDWEIKMDRARRDAEIAQRNNILSKQEIAINVHKENCEKLKGNMETEIRAMIKAVNNYHFPSKQQEIDDANRFDRSIRNGGCLKYTICYMFYNHDQKLTKINEKYKKKCTREISKKTDVIKKKYNALIENENVRRDNVLCNTRPRFY